MAGQCLSNEIAACLSSDPSLALRRLPRFDYGREFYAPECEVAEITQTPNAHISQPGPGLEGPIWLRNWPKGGLYDRRQFERSPVAGYCNISVIFLPSRFLCWDGTTRGSRYRQFAGDFRNKWRNWCNVCGV